MDASVKRIAPQTQCYQRRRPEKTLWYRTVQTHLETWLARQILAMGRDEVRNFYGFWGENRERWCSFV
jgi:hypothetical protein